MRWAETESISFHLCVWRAWTEECGRVTSCLPFNAAVRLQHVAGRGQSGPCRRPETIQYQLDQTETIIACKKIAQWKKESVKMKSRSCFLDKFHPSKPNTIFKKVHLSADSLPRKQLSVENSALFSVWFLCPSGGGQVRLAVLLKRKGGGDLGVLAKCFVRLLLAAAARPVTCTPPIPRSSETRRMKMVREGRRASALPLLLGSSRMVKKRRRRRKLPLRLWVKKNKKTDKKNKRFIKHFFNILIQQRESESWLTFSFLFLHAFSSPVNRGHLRLEGEVVVPDIL